MKTTLKQKRENKMSEYNISLTQKEFRANAQQIRELSSELDNFIQIAECIEHDDPDTHLDYHFAPGQKLQIARADSKKKETPKYVFITIHTDIGELEFTCIAGSLSYLRGYQASWTEESSYRENEWQLGIAPFHLMEKHKSLIEVLQSAYHDEYNEYHDDGLDPHMTDIMEYLNGFWKILKGTDAGTKVLGALHNNKRMESEHLNKAIEVLSKAKESRGKWDFYDDIFDLTEHKETV